MEMQVLYNFTAVLFGMAGVQMLGKPDLVLEVFTSGNTWVCEVLTCGNTWV